MTIGMCLAALAALAVGRILKWYVTRRWIAYCAGAKSLKFPRICPVCLLVANGRVEEESTPRQTASYILARKLEWWRAAIPHCSVCECMLHRYEILGVASGGICALGAMVINSLTVQREDGLFVGTLICIAFGYPAYAFFSTVKKGVVFGWGSERVLSMRIKSAAYFAELKRANSTPGPSREIPLANAGGVWRRS
jgi:hypothetical protein